MRNVDTGSGRPLGKVDHPETEEMVDDPVHITCYGAGFEAGIVRRDG